MSVIIPDPKIDERPGNVSQELYRRWRVEKDGTEEKFVPFNTRFAHDPEWREYWLNMTAAREGRYLIWKVGYALLFAAQFSMWLMR